MHTNTLPKADMSASATAERDAWQATVLLVCGASHMGKSYLVKSVLAKEYSVVYRQIDRVYTVAVTKAGMLKADAESKKHAERDARRIARDRRWPSPGAKKEFFASYEAQIRDAMHEGREKHISIVLEGGCLKSQEEIAVVERCAAEIFGPRVRLVRLTVEVPYERWLKNRVNRMLTSGVKVAEVRKLSPDTYEAEKARASVKPHKNILDYKVADPEQAHDILGRLNVVDLKPVNIG